MTAGQDGAARVWDADSGKLLVVIKGHQSALRSVSYSRDGRRIATGSDETDDTVRVWDADSGKLLAVYPGNGNGRHFVSYSPDGTHLLVRCDDQTELAREDTTETRTPAALSKQIACKTGARLDGTVIRYGAVDPAACDDRGSAPAAAARAN